MGINVDGLNRINRLGSKKIPDPVARMYQLIRTTYELFAIYSKNFPSREKFTSVTAVSNKILEMLDLYTKYNKQYHNKTTLSNLDIAHEQLKVLLDMLSDMGFFSYDNGKPTGNDSIGFSRYKNIMVYVNEIGSIIGGIIRFEKANSKQDNQ
jgi:hypothetical protein